MDGEVGVTRPVVHAGWSGPNTLVGQAGRQISPKILISFGISGAIQHTAAIDDADFIIAVNKNPNATMMKLADVAVVADANQACLAIIKEIKKKIQTINQKKTEHVYIFFLFLYKLHDLFFDIQVVQRNIGDFCVARKSKRMNEF